MTMGYPNDYRRNTPASSSSSSDPFWLLLSAILILALVLVGLPGIVAGFFGQRYTYRHLSRFGWRWSAAIWLVLSLLALLLLSALLQQGLQQMIQTQLNDVVQTAKHFRFDLRHWNFGRLWSETWPVWLRTLVGVPLWGLWFEISANMRGGQTAQMLVQGEQARQRRIARAQQRARKRVLRPERLPDEAGGLMVMGVPIDSDEEQE